MNIEGEDPDLKQPDLPRQQHPAHAAQELSARPRPTAASEPIEQPSTDSVFTWDTVPDHDGGAAQQRAFRVPARYTPHLLSTLIAVLGPGLTLWLGKGAPALLLAVISLAQLAAACAVLWICLREDDAS